MLLYLGKVIADIGLSLIAITFAITTIYTNRMTIKNLEPQFVYFKQIETTLNEVNSISGNIASRLADEARSAGFKITGPEIWNYYGVDGDPGTKIFIDICYPVEYIPGTQSKNVKTIEGFKCASTFLYGPWSELRRTYAELMAEMEARDLFPADYCREINHNCDYNNPENCVTEIQMGIKE